MYFLKYIRIRYMKQRISKETFLLKVLKKDQDNRKIVFTFTYFLKIKNL